MELELCLSLSLPYTPSKVFGFDLNEHCSNPCLDADKSGRVKRWRLDAAFGERSAPKVRLVSWNRQPNEEEDDGDSEERVCSAIYEDEEENNKVVGWPPIKSWMKKHHPCRHRRHHPYGRRRVESWSSSSSSSSSSTTTSSSSSTKSSYVKVKMEGVAIARKIDIKLFNSYESLTSCLVSMFAHYKGHDEDDTNYTFTYQCKEGDRLQLGNLPWKIFSERVHCIKINRVDRSMCRRYTTYV